MTQRYPNRITRRHAGRAVAVGGMLVAALLAAPRVGSAGRAQPDRAWQTVAAPSAARSAFTHLVTPASQGPFRPDVALAKGKFLVASRHLVDPNFTETVVLLIGYDAKGAMGLVINRPSDVKLSTVLPEVEELQQRADKVYVGGPVGRNQVILLVRSGKRPEGWVPVFDDVYLSSSLASLRQNLRNGGTTSGLRAYAGHAGWGPGQLDREIARGDWYVARGDADRVFDKAPSDVWPQIILRVEGQWAKVREPGLGAATEVACSSAAPAPARRLLRRHPAPPRGPTRQLSTPSSLR